MHLPWNATPTYGHSLDRCAIRYPLDRACFSKTVTAPWKCNTTGCVHKMTRLTWLFIRYGSKFAIPIDFCLVPCNLYFIFLNSIASFIPSDGTLIHLLPPLTRKVIFQVGKWRRRKERCTNLSAQVSITKAKKGLNKLCLLCRAC